jgi:AraC family transcriptional regulator of adaptative response / DNA-3-methyladenine glycosylase II
MQRTFGRPPSALRRRVRDEAPAAAGITLHLAHTRPYDWPAMLAFLKARAIPGIEVVEDDSYRRTISLAGAAGAIAVRRADDAHLVATIRFPKIEALPGIVARLRRMLDLDADAEAIAAHLSRDARLAPLVAKRPGLRVPGGWDEFELAVRAILGQQISVSAASTVAGRLAERFGRPVETGDAGLRVLFPQADVLASADLTLLGLPRLRAAAVSALAAAVVSDANLFRPYESLDRTIGKLVTLPGVGPWTAQYIAMRALREPDAFPASDLGLLRAAAGKGEMRTSPTQLAARAEAWRPWRAYAALHLWTAEGDDAASERERVGTAA